MRKFLSILLLSLGSMTSASDQSSDTTMWQSVKSFTASGASSIWDVTKSGSVTAWEATKSGSSVAWEKTKSGSVAACGYRPSNLIGGAGTGAAATAATATAAAGVGAKAAGFYTLTNAITGATMLGSTAGGVSAAGTVGIMGGTAGAIGTIGAVLMAPVTIVTGAVIGGGTAVFEGACYFAVDRLDDPELIMAVVQNLALQSDANYFELVDEADGAATIYVATEVEANGKVMERTKYSVDKLYIEDGVLRHKDWGPNTQLGKVGYVLGSLSDE
ncbi:hypothetical protein [Planktomarina temperata]